MLRSISSRFRLDYEWYNGKHFALQAGVNIFYPNRVLSYINEDIDFPKDEFAFHYKGAGGELKQSFCFPHRHWSPYIAFVESYDYKHFTDADIFIINGFRSSSYSYSENWSAHEQVIKTFIAAGFMTRARKRFSLDLSIGLGEGCFDKYSIFNSTTDRDYQQYAAQMPQRGGHDSFFRFQVYVGVKLC